MNKETCDLIRDLALYACGTFLGSKAIDVVRDWGNKALDNGGKVKFNFDNYGVDFTSLAQLSVQNYNQLSEK